MATKRKSTVQRETERAVKKAVKRTHKGMLLIVFLCLIIGAVGGYFTYRTLTKNDCFDLVGESEITLEVGADYSEAGVKIRSIGRDISAKATTEILYRPFDGEEQTVTAVDTQKEGEYIIVYRVKDVKYGDFKRVRVVTVGEDA